MTPSGAPPPPSWPPPPGSPPPIPPSVPVPPPVPPGPGVQPPFVAPPTDGVRRRRWIALAWSGAAAIVLCIGGVAGIGALAVFGSQMIVDQSTAAVRDYLTAVQDRQYAKAYSMLCSAEQRRISERQFATQQSERPFASFEVGRPDLNQQELVVPAVLHYNGGSAVTVNYQVAQNESTGEFEVCGTGG
jgi:hypothetical protein